MSPDGVSGQSQELSFRLGTPEDVPGLLELWAEETSWGNLSVETWNKWYVDTPFGECIMSLALDSQGVPVGQEVFTPARILIRDREVRGLRISGLIIHRLHQSWALSDPNQPAVGMLLTGLKAAADQGFSIVYTLPAPGGIQWFRALARAGFADFQTTSFPCLQLQLPMPSETREVDHKLVSQEVSGFSKEHEDLARWAIQSLRPACGIIRTARWLDWKNGDKGVMEVRSRDTGELVGFVCIETPGGLLTDFVVHPWALAGPVLRTAVLGLSSGMVEWGQDLAQVKAMATPALDPVLRALGFAQSGYPFGFACSSLDPSLPLEELGPEDWYIMPGD